MAIILKYILKKKQFSKYNLDCFYWQSVKLATIAFVTSSTQNIFCKNTIWKNTFWKKKHFEKSTVWNNTTSIASTDNLVISTVSYASGPN